MDFKDGDILFQDLQCGEVCTAIDDVTRGYNGARLDHCGMVCRDAQGAQVVIEAISPKVVATPLPNFLGRTMDARGRPCIMVGRVTAAFAPLTAMAISNGRDYIGKIYDKYFAEDDTALYCSELIVFAYARANHGEKIFAEYPMTFKDPATGEISARWADYFARLGASVPEGHIGSNPGALSRDAHIEIVRQLGDIAGAPRIGP